MTNNFEIDKSMWPDGPWKDEPDLFIWIDEETNLKCMIRRNPIGVLLGYVGIPDTHTLYRKNVEEYDLEVHGGITFPGAFVEIWDGKDRETIEVNPLIIPLKWWIGFDCGHGNDHIPCLPMTIISIRSYKDIDYVKAECHKLAIQLSKIKEKNK